MDKVLERVKDSVPKRVKECVLESIKASPLENVIRQVSLAKLDVYLRGLKRVLWKVLSAKRSYQASLLGQVRECV